jgi:hypothetical protein
MRVRVSDKSEETAGARSSRLFQYLLFWGAIMHPYTLDELKQKRESDLMGSAEAIGRQTDLYRELKALVHEINNSPLDVGDYHKTATRLGALLIKMTNGVGSTIFHYFAEHIDPDKAGDVRCFRFECLDLAEQMRQLEQWRAERHRLKRIK